MTTHATPLAVDLIGIFVFALSGALAAARVRFDIFGVIVVGTVTGIGGGLMRDVLLGIQPPAALRLWPYLAVPAVASVVTFYFAPHVARARITMLALDAAGLGVFTVAGTRQALDAGLGPAGASVVGVLTGIGGGVLRDVLLREIPLVLRREIYTLAALIGAAIVCGANALGVLNSFWTVVAGAVVMLVRGLAVWRQWSAPRARYLDDQAGA